MKKDITRQKFEPICSRTYYNSKIRLYNIGDLREKMYDIAPGMSMTWDGVGLTYTKIKDPKKLNIKLEKLNKRQIQVDKKRFIEHIFLDYFVTTLLFHIDELIYARKMVFKNYPGFLRHFNKLYPDKRDVVKSIEKELIESINNFNTAPNIKLYITDKNDYILKWAFKQLENQGYNLTPGFQEAWELLTNLYQLNPNIDKNI